MADSIIYPKNTCPICLTRLNNKCELGRPNSCSHSFCLPCIQEWSKNVNTCPVDRKKFSTIEVYSHRGNLVRKIHVPNRRFEDNLADPNDITLCEVCSQSTNENVLLLCDGCDKGYHTYCLTPSLKKVPEGNWYCSTCHAIVTSAKIENIDSDASSSDLQIEESEEEEMSFIGARHKRGVVIYTSDEDDDVILSNKYCPRRILDDSPSSLNNNNNVFFEEDEPHPSFKKGCGLKSHDNNKKKRISSDESSTNLTFLLTESDLKTEVIKIHSRTPSPQLSPPFPFQLTSGRLIRRKIDKISPKNNFEEPLTPKSIPAHSFNDSTHAFNNSTHTFNDTTHSLINSSTHLIYDSTHSLIDHSNSTHSLIDPTPSINEPRLIKRKRESSESSSRSKRRRKSSQISPKARTVASYTPMRLAFRDAVISSHKHEQKDRGLQEAQRIVKRCGLTLSPFSPLKHNLTIPAMTTTNNKSSQNNKIITRTNVSSPVKSKEYMIGNRLKVKRYLTRSKKRKITSAPSEFLSPRSTTSVTDYISSIEKGLDVLGSPENEILFQRDGTLLRQPRNDINNSNVNNNITLSHYEQMINAPDNDKEDKSCTIISTLPSTTDDNTDWNINDSTGNSTNHTLVSTTNCTDSITGTSKGNSAEVIITDSSGISTTNSVLKRHRSYSAMSFGQHSSRAHSSTNKLFDTRSNSLSRRKRKRPLVVSRERTEEEKGREEENGREKEEKGREKEEKEREKEEKEKRREEKGREEEEKEDIRKEDEKEGKRIEKKGSERKEREAIKREKIKKEEKKPVASCVLSKKLPTQANDVPIPNNSTPILKSSRPLITNNSKTPTPLRKETSKIKDHCTTSSGIKDKSNSSCEQPTITTKITTKLATNTSKMTSSQKTSIPPKINKNHKLNLASQSYTSENLIDSLLMQYTTTTENNHIPPFSTCTPTTSVQDDELPSQITTTGRFNMYLSSKEAIDTVTKLLQERYITGDIDAQLMERIKAKAIKKVQLAVDVVPQMRVQKLVDDYITRYSHHRVINTV